LLVFGEQWNTHILGIKHRSLLIVAGIKWLE